MGLGVSLSLFVAMRALEAKVSESCSTGCSFSASLGGTADVADADAEGAGANGFAEGLLPVEKGFAVEDPGLEKGFAFWLPLGGCTPNNDSPMLVCLGLVSSAGGGDACSDGCLF